MARTKEELLLLAVSGTAAAVAVVAVREATPSDTGLWLATAGALALALACLFAFWFGGAARRRVADSTNAEPDVARALLSALPDGLLVVRDETIVSVNRSLCDQLGFDRGELLGSSVPYPFWAPEHRHEIEAFHADLAAHGEHAGELTFVHKRGDRIRVLVSGRLVVDEGARPRHLLTVRDVSESHRREQRLTELAARDADTGLLDLREFEERLRDCVRRAMQGSSNVTVVLAELSADSRPAASVFTRPETLLAVERLKREARAGDVLARTGEAELGWILPETDTAGGLDAVERWRAALADIGGVVLTAGVCDLAGGGDALGTYALADRALTTARRRGAGSTEAHLAAALPVLPPRG